MSLRSHFATSRSPLSAISMHSKNAACVDDGDHLHRQRFSFRICFSTGYIQPFPRKSCNAPVRSVSIL